MRYYRQSYSVCWHQRATCWHSWMLNVSQMLMLTVDSGRYYQQRTQNKELSTLIALLQALQPQHFAIWHGLRARAPPQDACLSCWTQSVSVIIMKMIFLWLWRERAQHEQPLAAVLVWLQKAGQMLSEERTRANVDHRPRPRAQSGVKSHPAASRSHSLLDTEQGYAQIEKDSWLYGRFSSLLIGNRFPFSFWSIWHLPTSTRDFPKRLQTISWEVGSRGIYQHSQRQAVSYSGCITILSTETTVRPYLQSADTQ